LQVRRQAVSWRIAELKANRVTAMDQRKTLWQREHSLNLNKKNLQESRASAEQKFDHLKGSAVSAAMVVLQQQNVQLTYGFFLDLLEFDSELDLAVCAVARSRLFFLVVETDEIANDIIDLLKEHKAGRLSTFALNRMTRQAMREIPTSETISPLIARLRFNEDIRPAVDFVFGGVAVCSTLEVAVQSVALIGVVCVTVTGDIVYPGGPMVGGDDATFAARRSATRMKRVVVHYEAEIASVHELLQATTDELAAVDSEMRGYVQSMGELTSEEVSIGSSLESKSAELEEIQIERADLEKRLKSAEKRAEFVQKSLTLNNERREALLSRIEASDSSNSFSREEHRQVCTQFGEQMLALESARLELANVQSQIRQIEQKLSEFDLSRLRDRLDRLRMKKSHVSLRIDRFDEDVRAHKSDLASIVNELQEDEELLEGMIEKLCELERQYGTKQKSVSAQSNNLALQCAKRDEVRRKLSACGTCPAEEIEARREMDRSDLLKEMAEINERLGRFRFVNKRAFDQFRQFGGQSELLRLRQEGINISEAAINELIGELDRKKKDSISAVFGKVSERFEAIYGELEPNQTGALVLKQRGDFVTEFDPDHVTGLGIVVGDEPIEALSGGQKTIVALSLIFAMQQIQPNPFYILDEVDSDLDAQHRTRLAALLNRMAFGEMDASGSPVQFIFASHRNEIVGIADKFFAVHAVSPTTSTAKEVERAEVAKYLEESPEDGIN
jgi:structural maintenance of chromosome 3 (chondroitin sulfate proteoglycan 6)